MDDVVRPDTFGQSSPEPTPWKPLPQVEPLRSLENEETVHGAAYSTAAEGPVAMFERLETAMVAGFADLLREFRDKLALDRFKEEQITRLHDELQAYRNDLVHRSARQILQGLIRLHDDLGKVVGSLRQKPDEELTPERFFQQLDGFRDDLELLLGQHGVERFEVSAEQFDPRRQTALRTIPTGDSALVGRIAARLRPGFEQGETLLQKERVTVYAAASGINGKS